jgi:hypothetical protein
MVRILAFAFAGVTACFGGDSNDVPEPIDAPVDAPVDAPLQIDATVDAPEFLCANDSSLEPNNDPQSAFITPVDNPTPSYSLVGLAICPQGDVDHFRFGISINGTNVETTVTGVAGRTPLAVAVLNASGTPIATGTPVAGTPHVIRIVLANQLAVGTYFLQVRAPDNSENNYNLQIKTCTTPLPCP